MLCGTEIAYGAVRCPELSQRMGPCYGTELAYGPMLHAVLSWRMTLCYVRAWCEQISSRGEELMTAQVRTPSLYAAISAQVADGYGRIAAIIVTMLLLKAAPMAFMMALLLFLAVSPPFSGRVTAVSGGSTAAWGYADASYCDGEAVYVNYGCIALQCPGCAAIYAVSAVTYGSNAAINEGAADACGGVQRGDLFGVPARLASTGIAYAGTGIAYAGSSTSIAPHAAIWPGYESAGSRAMSWLCCYAMLLPDVRYQAMLC
eukprot:855779-Rhodomonas_salina.3